MSLNSSTLNTVVKTDTNDLDERFESITGTETFDFCLVLSEEWEKNLFDGDGETFFREKYGLITRKTVNIVRDEIYIELKASTDRLRSFCDGRPYDFLLDPIKLREYARSHIPPVIIDEDEKDYPKNATKIKPFELIFTDYSKKLPEDLYYRTEGQSNPFTTLIRQKLIVSLIEAERDDGEAFTLEKHIRKGHIMKFFAPHGNADDYLKSKLAYNWVYAIHLPMYEPNNDVKDYFGEQVALFYVFATHWRSWLFFPGCVGVIFQAFMWKDNNYNHAVQPFMAVFMVFWAILMLEFWKRKEKMNALHWGTFDCEEDEEDRPEFVDKVEEKISPISGKLVPYFPDSYRRPLYCISYSTISVVLVIVIGTVAAIYSLRVLNFIDQFVASIINSVLIQVFNYLYRGLAVWLTKHETHRTDTDYEDALITKVFLFQFINSYVSFFYLAFVFEYVSVCPDYGKTENDCMFPLATNLGIIYATRVFLGPLTTFFVPYFTFRAELKSKNISIKEYPFLSPMEKEFLLVKFDELDVIFQNYLDQAVGFGYMTLFAAALPAAPMVALMSDYICDKMDAYVLLFWYQRPIPKSAEDIGTWQSVFTIIAIISVLTNAGLIVFTMKILVGWSYVGKFWVFIGMILFCYFFQYLLQLAIPDEPTEFKLQIKRIKYMNEVVLKQDELAGLDEA